MAVNLWNWAVTKRVGLVITVDDKAKCTYIFFDPYCEKYSYYVSDCVLAV